MEDTLIDIDTLNGAIEAIDTIRMFRLIAERGATFEGVEISCNADDLYEYRIMFLETYATEAFPQFSEYQVNDVETFPHAKHFEDMIDYFDPEEQYVVGFLFDDPYLYKFYEMCKEKGISMENTMLGTYLSLANNAIPSYSDGYTYMEVFIPYDNIIEDTKAPIMLFFTDSSLASHNMLESLLMGFEYCKSVVNGEIELKEVE